jgi:Holliday junction resolvase RusA-like endonuclease
MTLGEVLNVRVYGLPVAQGRPRARMFQDRSGTTRVSVYDPHESRDWKRTVMSRVVDVKPAAPVAETALEMALVFHLPRPQSLPKRVVHHIRRPDVDNLAKAIKDALRGIVYRDDSQIVRLQVEKRYGDTPGVEIVVARLVAPAPAQPQLAAAGR